jgi:diguanylate cyclase (GGDEF)-like protein
LRGACRGGDHLARWGGEEFVVLLVDATGEEAKFIAERLRSAVAHIDWSSASEALQLTLSAGIATGPAAASLATLLRAADGALYAAKQNGRDRTCIAPD